MCLEVEAAPALNVQDPMIPGLVLGMAGSLVDAQDMDDEAVGDQSADAGDQLLRNDTNEILIRLSRLAAVPLPIWSMRTGVRSYECRRCG